MLYYIKLTVGRIAKNTTNAKVDSTPSIIPKTTGCKLLTIKLKNKKHLIIKDSEK